MYGVRLFTFSAPHVPPGQQFSGQIVPSATVLVVGVGRTEAKVEGLFSEVCRLDFKGNVLDSMGGEVLKGGQATKSDGAVFCCRHARQRRKHGRTR